MGLYEDVDSHDFNLLKTHMVPLLLFLIFTQFIHMELSKTV